MTDLFMEAASQLDLPSVRQWKDRGGKTIGYTCSFIPVEIFRAARLLPIRQRGIKTESMAIADAYYGPFVCSYPKAVLQNVGAGDYAFLDGAVISTGCDAMRRLDECWRKMSDDIPGTMPPFFHYFDVPHKPDDFAVSWYMDQVKRLMEALAHHFSLQITETDLHEAIVMQNGIRKKLYELTTLRTGDTIKISGTEAYGAIIASTVMPGDDFCRYMDTFLDNAKQRPTDLSQGKKRIYITGSVCDDTDLIRLIESSGAVVVGENVCFGVRDKEDLVREEGDPIRALTDKYLSGSACPRMFGWYQSRLENVLNRIAEGGVDGVVMQSIRFCDMHGSENGLMERDLEARGIPVIRIEREYGPMVETGRLKMRIDAFIEQLKKRKA